jgi:hypothetical protein
MGIYVFPQRKRIKKQIFHDLISQNIEFIFFLSRKRISNNSYDSNLYFDLQV